MIFKSIDIIFSLLLKSVMKEAQSLIYGLDKLCSVLLCQICVIMVTIILGARCLLRPSVLLLCRINFHSLKFDVRNYGTTIFEVSVIA